jgi:two-component system alkaline phosphatase synthesis response regulator PhoP
MQAKRILVVEDHSSVRTMFRVILEDEGYRVAEAEDGDAALQAAESLLPDLILLDLMMPRLDGERVLEQMYDNSNLRSTPVLVVSAKQEAMDRVMELVGSENVFSKPFDHQQVVDRIKELIGPGEKKASSPWKG